MSSSQNIEYKMTLTDKIINLIEQAKSGVARVANSAMVCTNYLIGKLIVEEYQQGETRAEYGANLLQNVLVGLTQKLGKGYSVQNLERMRNFFLIYSKSSKELRNSEVFQKSSNNLRIFGDEDIKLLPVSWSHYLFLMQIDNEQERQFYEIESFQNNWKLEELKRQYNSGLYERLALSKDKDAVWRLAREGQLVENQTIGIILCKNKNENLVEITLPKDKKQIFAAKYSTVLPQKAELKALLENSQK